MRHLPHARPQVKDRLTVAPKTLSYLETGLVSYQGFPAGKTKQGPSKQPVQIYRLQEPLVLGKFIKWSSNAGEALAAVRALHQQSATIRDASEGCVRHGFGACCGCSPCIVPR